MLGLRAKDRPAFDGQLLQARREVRGVGADDSG